MTNEDDPISAASSGLRALGVAPQRRVETLGLLSALMDLADEVGRVELDAALMAAEERLGIDACLEGYEWLERLDVIRRTYAGWVIPNFAAHNGPAGMTEASLAILQKHFAMGDDAPVVVITPTEPAPAEAPVVQLKPWRRRATVIAASAAAGVAMLAGATQFVPQAAVTTRNVSARGATPTHEVAVGTTPAAPGATAGVATTSATNSGTDEAAGPQVTTTTSTTLLPGLPCVGDVLRDLSGRTGLRTTQTTQNAPGVLPCP